MSRESAIRILIIDDHEIVRIGLKLVLEKWKSVEIVGEGADGNTALSLVKELKPDVVVMDLAMPEMDGIQATKQIRGWDEKIGIIILTSQTHAEDVRAALAAGVNGYCLKDVDDERLQRAILCVADGDIWLDSRVAQAALEFAIDTEKKSGTGSSSFNKLNASEYPRKKSTAASERTAFPSESPKRLKDFELLSDRELEVLRLLVQGLTNREIGEQLFITRDTVKTHIRHIMEKLAAKDRTDAAVKAIQRKLI